MSRHFRCHWFLCSAIIVIFIGCDSRPSTDASRSSTYSAGPSDLEEVRSADISILFVGNSHTSMHDLPGLIGDMIHFRHPELKVYSHFVPVGFLEDVASNPQCRQEIETRPWRYVVLQAQKESRSGRFQYSQTEGIDIAKLAKSHGATAIYYSEWGLKDNPGHGKRIEQIYREMAAAADARVAPVGRAWDLALAARPELPLYSGDGNHQSELGAFLTAAVLFSRLTGESASTLADFSYERLDAADRTILLNSAVQAIDEINALGAKD